MNDLRPRQVRWAGLTFAKDSVVAAVRCGLPLATCRVVNTLAWWLNQTSGSAMDMANGPHVTSPVWKGDASRFVPGTFRLSRQPTPSSMWSLINGDVLTRPEWVGLGATQDSTKSLRRAPYFLKVYGLSRPEVHGHALECPRLDIRPR